MVDSDTIVCRCEDVTYGQIKSLIDRGCAHPDDIKRILRCGMGPCQGRTCQDLIRRILADCIGEGQVCGIEIKTWNRWTARPPVRPVEIGVLAGKTKDDTR
ncbi:MAG: (2Fe-2S)-binding protein [bacterium]|jgi:NAD(P)H-nitrite reductase large subunit|nr:(2Fe-2S)-binding protein [bacterium]